MSAEKGQSRFGRIWSNYRIVFVFVIFYIVCTLLTHGKFGTWNNMSTILRNASTIGVIALGMTFVIIAGGMDLSSGPVLACVGSIFIFLQGAGYPLALPVLACIGAAIGIGLVNGLIITKAKIPPFIVTLAIGIIARSVTTFICQGKTVTGDNTDTFVKKIGNGSIGSIPIPLIIMLVMAVILTIILTKTKLGTYIIGVGCNENAARYSGINVERIKIITYMIVGACTGIAAVIEMSRMVAVSSVSSGQGYEFDAITAVLVGGTALEGGRGTIYGTVIGAVLLQFVNNMMVQMNISIYLAGTLKGIIIFLAVFLNSRNRSGS
ncbi:MAG: ABC transporter permease [Firmicutes bacterium]|nr:ABC transporter permease [Bacillota bacterium]